MSKKLTGKQIKVGLRVIWEFFKDHKKAVGILFLVNIIIAIGNGVVPYLTGSLFDSILDPNGTLQFLGFDILKLPLMLSVLFLIQVAIAGINYYKDPIQEKIAFHARFDYQIKAYKKLLDLPISFHKKHKLGKITTKFDMAGWGMQTLIARMMSSSGTELLTVAVALAIIFAINIKMAIFVSVGLLFFLSMAEDSVKKAGNHEEKYWDAWEDAYGDAYDVVVNTATVKQAAAEEHEKENIAKGFMGNILPLWIRKTTIWNDLRFYQQSTIIFVQVVIFVWSIQLVTMGSMTIGQLIAFNAYLGMLFGPFVRVFDMIETIQSGFTNIHSLEKILATPSENYHPKNAVKIDEIHGDIEFEKVSFHYDTGKPVLRDISFKAKAGEVIALVGESGVGKSTTIDLLTAFNFPKKGQIKIDGHDIKKIDLTLLRSKIAMVPQEVVLFNDTIKKNIQYGSFKATDKEIEEAAKKAHALDFIKKFPKKWKQIVGERGVKLSVGQKQRVAIARAVLRDPRILILDEPTSALDAKSESIIDQSLTELMRGRTTFIVAHRLSTVRKADQILVFEEGKIVERGRHEELIKKPNGVYRKLYELQIGLHA